MGNEAERLRMLEKQMQGLMDLIGRMDGQLGQVTAMVNNIAVEVFNQKAMVSVDGGEPKERVTLCGAVHQVVKAINQAKQGEPEAPAQSAPATKLEVVKSGGEENAG